MEPYRVKIEESWRQVLSEEFRQPYFDQIKKYLVGRKNSGATVYPPGPLIFNAFELTPFDKLKVVILGQDPYHGPREAMGLCFSVPEAIRIPPSLKNIYKELHQDVKVSIPSHGNLTSWAKQGVFLLNALLTVEHKKPGSHKQIGWHLFTDAVIKSISDNKEDIIFLLWGNFAQSKTPLINQLKHYVLTAAHPSPLARNAFSGCAHFSRTNDLLRKMDKEEIDWRIE